MARVVVERQENIKGGGDCETEDDAVNSDGDTRKLVDTHKPPSAKRVIPILFDLHLSDS